MTSQFPLSNIVQETRVLVLAQNAYPVSGSEATLVELEGDVEAGGSSRY